MLKSICSELHVEMTHEGFSPPTVKDHLDPLNTYLLAEPPVPARAPEPEQAAAPALPIPGVNVSGSTWSKNPALRTLIANGKVVQEGQDIAPGVRLEAIGPRSAVLNHQGLRYSIGY